MPGKRPKGRLTAGQLEILEVFWEREPSGTTVTGAWEATQARRQVARNTVLTMIGRLEKRGWLRRVKGSRPQVYRVACAREDASERLAGDFIDSFFAGSAVRLVMSLLGSREISEEELQRIRELFDESGSGS